MNRCLVSHSARPAPTSPRSGKSHGTNYCRWLLVGSILAVGAAAISYHIGPDVALVAGLAWIKLTLGFWRHTA